jgi:hypothetical protein
MFFERNHHGLLHLVMVYIMRDVFLLTKVIQGTRNIHAKDYN